MHRVKTRVYYEDTDAGGVVYYANYLKFAERARTEFLREGGINQSDLVENSNVMFVVKKADLEIFRPARLDDLIEIKSEVVEQKGARIFMEQNIYLEKTKLCNIKTCLAVINSNFKPVRLPEFLKDIFS
jgi:acyl-CoA thioester hydrolase